MMRQWLAVALASVAIADLPPGALALPPPVPLLLPVYIGDAPLVVPLPLPLIVEDNRDALQQHLADFCAAHGLPSTRCKVVYEALTTAAWATDEKAVFLVVNDLLWQWVDMPAESLASRICHYVAVQANHPHMLDPSMCLTTLELAFARTEAWKRMSKAGLSLPYAPAPTNVISNATAPSVENVAKVIEEIDSADLLDPTPELSTTIPTAESAISEPTPDALPLPETVDDGGDEAKVHAPVLEVTSDDDVLEVTDLDDEESVPTDTPMSQPLLAGPMAPVFSTAPESAAIVDDPARQDDDDAAALVDVAPIESATVHDALAETVPAQGTTPIEQDEQSSYDDDTTTTETVLAPARPVSSGRYLHHAVLDRTRGNLTRSYHDADTAMLQCAIDLIPAVDADVLVVAPAAPILVDVKGHGSCPTHVADHASPVLVVLWAIVLGIIALLWRRNLVAAAQLDVCAAEIARLHAAQAAAIEDARADKEALAIALREPTALRHQLAEASARLASLQDEKDALDSSRCAEMDALRQQIASYEAVLAEKDRQLAAQHALASLREEARDVEMPAPLPDHDDDVSVEAVALPAMRSPMVRQSSSLLDTVISNQEGNARPKHSRFGSAARTIALGWSLMHVPKASTTAPVPGSELATAA
ncbi:hypothetical protein SPRG_08177 [Saprolegnia parasitica CBS 223.65]|uniref:TPM domain-containing protein n=1 Tax=Saprolegnia parasitica (strain CBS 223.65) TaxID=695850 RepID=A0A067C6G9_SAPPC|nr:hypothetical protein SPRG_08177 [Saprolegnia parasitica CBS 223.65]KDO26374.1 hypothetical protein SPRG_08177 [Saprolegnia parasitica CBS 223.65]|eukprot:XP_012202812.1 hypothetical protein SPRG_08177 [Saprolegnia parasitica CBS 223.65]